MIAKHKYLIRGIITSLLIFGFFSQLHSQEFVFHHLNIIGNKRTQELVFLREMGVSKGDTVPKADSMLSVWQKRISGLNLFNFVDLGLKGDTISIKVLERIYIWPKPYLQWADRNFNVWWQTKDLQRLVYGGTLYLNNLHGLNHSAYVTVISGYNQMLEFGYKSAFAEHSNGWA